MSPSEGDTKRWSSKSTTPCSYKTVSLSSAIGIQPWLVSGKEDALKFNKADESLRVDNFCVLGENLVLLLDLTPESSACTSLSLW